MNAQLTIAAVLEELKRLVQVNVRPAGEQERVIDRIAGLDQPLQPPRLRRVDPPQARRVAVHGL